MSSVRGYTTRSGRRVRAYSRGVGHVMARNRLAGKIAGLQQGQSLNYRGRNGEPMFVDRGPWGALAPKGANLQVRVGGKRHFARSPKHAAQLVYRAKRGESLGGLRHSSAASSASRTRVVSAKATKPRKTTRRTSGAVALAGPEFRGDPNNDRHVIDFYKKLGMGELRRRQDLTTQQIGHAYKQRNTKALEHLQRQERLLTHAVYEKNFG